MGVDYCASTGLNIPIGSGFALRRPNVKTTTIKTTAATATRTNINPGEIVTGVGEVEAEVRVVVVNEEV